MITIRVAHASPLLTDPTIAARFDDLIAAELTELTQLAHGLVEAGTPSGVSAGGGGLRGSLFTELRGTPGHRQGIVATSLVYGQVVERGRPPGRQPPVGALDTWVARKLGVPEGQVRRVAFLVGRKIGRVGYRGAFMFQHAADQLQGIVQARFAALDARIRTLFGGA
jgi:hypothetical protein